jgi:hypothetical protein
VIAAAESVCATCAAATEMASLVVVLLGRADDTVHHLHRFGRIVAGRRLGGEHHRIGAVVDRRRYVGGLGAGRGRRVDHRLQHLRCHHDRGTRFAAGMDDLLLAAGHRLGRHFDAEVSACDHHAVAQRNQLIQAVECGGLFDLGHDRRPIVDQLPGLHDVLGALDERQGHPVDAQIEAEHQVLAVLVGNR